MFYSVGLYGVYGRTLTVGVIWLIFGPCLTRSHKWYDNLLGRFGHGHIIQNHDSSKMQKAIAFQPEELDIIVIVQCGHISCRRSHWWDGVYGGSWIAPTMCAYGSNSHMGKASAFCTQQFQLCASIEHHSRKYCTPITLSPRIVQ